MRVLILVLAAGCGGTAPAGNDAAVEDTGRPPVDVGVDTGVVPDGGAALDASKADRPDMGFVADAAEPDAGFLDAGGVDAGTASATGTMSLLAYNVAGLPQALSGGNPRVNTPLISPLLNLYDLALVQEDFAYHAELSADANHPHQSTPLNPPGVNMGDGLNRFSITPFSNHYREAWIDCNGIIDSGSDCLTDKGFSVARHELAPGVSIDIYNLHMDAGRSMDDYDTRVLQIQQLTSYMATRSGADAVIVAGDTNLKDDDEPALLDFMATAQLEDACRTLQCPDPTLHDRVMYRSSPALTLEPVLWQLDPAFVDGDGDPLSDHDAVGVDFNWRAD